MKALKMLCFDHPHPPSDTIYTNPHTLPNTPQDHVPKPHSGSRDETLSVFRSRIEDRPVRAVFLPAHSPLALHQADRPLWGRVAWWGQTFVTQSPKGSTYQRLGEKRPQSSSVCIHRSAPSEENPP